MLQLDTTVMSKICWRIDDKVEGNVYTMGRCSIGSVGGYMHCTLECINSF